MRISLRWLAFAALLGVSSCQHVSAHANVPTRSAPSGTEKD